MTHGAPHADLIPPDTSPASAAVSASSRQGHGTGRPALMRSVRDVYGVLSIRVNRLSGTGFRCLRFVAYMQCLASWLNLLYHVGHRGRSRRTAAQETMVSACITKADETICLQSRAYNAANRLLPTSSTSTKFNTFLRRSIIRYRIGYSISYRQTDFQYRRALTTKGLAEP